MRGKVGSLVFSQNKGLNIVKAAPTVVANPRSAQQQANRSRFVALLALGKSLRPILQLGYKEYAHVMSWLNKFMSTNASSGLMVWDAVNFDWNIDFSKLVVAEGSLHPQPVGLNEVDGNDLILDWNPVPISNQNAADKLCIVAFCKTETLYSLREISRSVGTITLSFSPTLNNGDVITWSAFFISPDGLIVSSSYTAQVTVGP